jgi:hypothetical protein
MTPRALAIKLKFLECHVSLFLFYFLETINNLILVSICAASDRTKFITGQNPLPKFKLGIL